MLFGQSAGGESILIHLSSPIASGGLFHKAVSESGPMSLNFKVFSLFNNKIR
jgi:carboxylesterase type B